MIVTATGGIPPYTYSIDMSSWFVSNVFTGLWGGVHNISVRDASSAVVDTSFTIGETSPLSPAYSTTPTVCNGGNGGTVTVTASGGTAPYKYMLTGYQNDTITGSQAIFTQMIYAASYPIEIVDANGCYGYVFADVPNGDSLRGTAAVISPSCSSADDGMIQINFNNGFPPYDLYEPAWSLGMNGVYNDGTSSWSGGFASGNYSWQVMDSIGCIGVLNMVIPVSPPAVTHAGTDTLICSGSSVHLSGAGNGAMISLGFHWSPATGLSNTEINNPIATAATTTSYILTTSAYSSPTGSYCISSDTITITVNDIATPLVEYNTPVLSVTNIQPGVTYTWQELNGTVWTDVGTGNSYTVQNNNDYRVRASGGGCEQYSNSLTVARPASGNPFAIAMYPNPATNVLMLNDLKLTDQWQTLEIINYQGQRAIPLKDIRNQTSVAVNVLALTSGIYIAKLTKGDGRTVQLRFLKQ